jgi:hypothetical protein
MGPSDIEGQSWTKKERLESGKVKGSAGWSGFLPIQPFVMQDSTLSRKSTFALIGIHETLRVPKNADLNIFNLVGDADASSSSLNMIRKLDNEIKPSRCFNHPENIFRTGRERLPSTLSDIPGCRVPRVMSSEPKSYSELEHACDEFDAWPLIIRARGYHGGEKMVLVENKSQLGAMGGCQWLYRGIFLIEFVDYRNRDNLYQKSRIILVDGIPYPRHSIISDHCFIHASSRADLMDEDPGLRRQEEDFLAYLRDDGLNRDYGQVFGAIQERIALDVFGVDFSVVDGEVVVFEANACMNFLFQDYGLDGCYRYIERYVRDLKRAVKKMLMKA